MALFNLKKNKEKEKKESQPSKLEKQKKEVDKEEKSLKPARVRMDQGKEGGETFSHVLLRPRITEKASYIAADGAYTFNVDVRTNKREVRKAIEEIYDVTPRKIHMINTPSKSVIVRNKPGTKSGFKKAIVYLKEGDKIEFV